MQSTEIKLDELKIVKGTLPCDSMRTYVEVIMLNNRKSCPFGIQWAFQGGRNITGPGCVKKIPKKSCLKSPGMKKFS